MIDTGGVLLDVRLLRILGYIESKGYSVDVTSTKRTFSQHIAIYHQIAQAKKIPFDISQVPLNSRHLPCWTQTDCRAVDFSVRRQNIFLTGRDIYRMIKEAQKMYPDYIGIGIANFWVHLDCDRSSNAIWSY